MRFSSLLAAAVLLVAGPVAADPPALRDVKARRAPLGSGETGGLLWVRGGPESLRVELEDGEVLRVHLPEARPRHGALVWVELPPGEHHVTGVRYERRDTRPIRIHRWRYVDGTVRRIWQRDHDARLPVRVGSRPTYLGTIEAWAEFMGAGTPPTTFGVRIEKLPPEALEVRWETHDDGPGARTAALRRWGDRARALLPGEPAPLGAPFDAGRRDAGRGADTPAALARAVAP